MPKLLIYGGSGHAKDVVNVALELGYHDIIIATTDGTGGFWGIPVVQDHDGLAEEMADHDFFVAIGDNTLRRQFSEKYSRLNTVNLVAPTAHVSPQVTLGSGIFIGHHVYLGPDSVVGDGAILNVGSVIGHDCRIGAYSQVSPNATLLGCVQLGEKVFVGSGAIVRNAPAEAPITIADDVSVGMGVLVTESITEPGLKLLPKPNSVVVKG